MKFTSLLIASAALYFNAVAAWDLTYYASEVTFIKAEYASETTAFPTTGATTTGTLTTTSSSATSSGYFNSSTTYSSASFYTVNTASLSLDDVAAASASSVLSDFALAILDEHNAKRALHGSPALVWNTDLAAFAEEYVYYGYDTCKDGSLEHSAVYYDETTGYGENIALGYNYTGTVDAWYSEIKNYNWTDPEGSSTGEIGHFTQVVWNTSTELGCAYKYCGSYYSNYVVCEYYPPGNVVGTYAEHVPPLLDDDDE